MKASYQINQRALMTELTASEPILKKSADAAMREAFFEPAVAAMAEEFKNDFVTKEIAAGVDSENISETLDAVFREDAAKNDSKANLTGFIGFDESPDLVLKPIRDRLDPANPDGPKMIYKGSSKNKLEFRYEIRAPNEEAIYRDTPIPWSPGISWAKRIEQGISGIGYFLNRQNASGSRSGGGIQIDDKIRSGRFKPRSYLSKIFNNFLRRVAGAKENGRVI